MTENRSFSIRRLFALTARRAMALGIIAVMTLGVMLAAAPAQARVFVGVGVPLPYFGPPAYYYPPPPVYYAPPPPVYYAPPPPVTYAPPGPSATYGQSCNAGSYVCPMERPAPSGASCFCRGNYGERVNGYTQ